MTTFWERESASSSGGGGSITTFMVRSGVLSFTLAAGQTNDFTNANLGVVSVIRFRTNVAGSSLSGIVAQTAGTQFSICNKGPTGDLTLLNATGSVAANQFEFLLLGDIIIPAGDSIDIWYDSISSKWIKI